MVKKIADELCGQSLNTPIKCPLHYSKSKGGFNDTTKARLQFTLNFSEKDNTWTRQNGQQTNHSNQELQYSSNS